MANTMAARKREPGEIVTVSLVTAVLLSLLNTYFKPTLPCTCVERHYDRPTTRRCANRFPNRQLDVRVHIV